jgi:hypothetical protein
MCGVWYGIPVRRAAQEGEKTEQDIIYDGNEHGGCQLAKNC